MSFKYTVDDTAATEDKTKWVAASRTCEDYFIDYVLPQFYIKAEPNNIYDHYAPDFNIDGVLADLKYSESPFILSTSYGVKDCRYAHSFNHKDYVRYKTYYPDIIIFFWHNFFEPFCTVGTTRYAVDPMSAVWYTPFSILSESIASRAFPVHTYTRRVDDVQGNAKESYVLDLTHKAFRYLGEVND